MDLLRGIEITSVFQVVEKLATVRAVLEPFFVYLNTNVDDNYFYRIFFSLTNLTLCSFTGSVK